MSSGAVGRLGIWWEGLIIGLETITSAPVLSAKRLILPVSNLADRRASICPVTRGMPNAAVFSLL